MALKLDINKTVETRLKFEAVEAFNNLCAGYITSVEVLEREIPATDKKGEPTKSEYAGHTVKTLNIHFQNHKLVATDFDRFYTKDYFTVQTVKNDGNKVSEAGLTMKVKLMMESIQHIANQYVPQTSELALNKYPAYIAAFGELCNNIDSDDVDVRIKCTSDYYQAAADWFNGITIGKGATAVTYPKVYVKGNDQFIPMTMKLVIDPQNNRFGFPEFVNEGFIQPFAKGTDGKIKTSLKFRPDESVVAIAKRKAPIANGLPGTEEGNGGADDIMSLLRAQGIQ